MTHIEIEHEPMGLIIRADGIVGPDGCDDAGCYDLGMYVPDKSKPKVSRATGFGTTYKVYPVKWVSALEGVPKEWADVIRMNLTELYHEDLKTDIECKEEQGRE